MPNDFEEIFTHVQERLGTFEEIQTEESSTRNSINIKKIRSAKTIIDDDIAEIEKYTVSRYKEVENVHDWFNILHAQQQTTNMSETEGKQMANDFVFSFKTNMNQLTSLQTDLLVTLQNLIENRETPTSIKFKYEHQAVTKELENRRESVRHIQRTLNHAIDKFDQASIENNKLKNEMTAVELQLSSFQDKQGYDIVQKAKKYIIAIDEWNVKKESLSNQIADIKAQIKAFQEKSTNTSDITKAISNCEEKYVKAEKRYKELILTLNQETGIMERCHAQVNSQLEKDLSGLRSSQRALEKKETSMVIKRTAIADERALNKFKKELASYKAQLEKSIKQAKGDPDACIDIISHNQVSIKEFLTSVFEKEIEELDIYQKRYIDAIMIPHKGKLENIKVEQEQEKALLQSKKARIIMKFADRQIEIKSLNAQISTYDSLVQDVTNVCNEAELRYKINNDLFNKNENQRNGVMVQMQKEMAKSDVFIEKANYMIEYYVDRLYQKIPKAVQCFPVIENRPKSSMASLRQRDPSPVIVLKESELNINNKAEEEDSDINEEEEYSFIEEEDGGESIEHAERKHERRKSSHHIMKKKIVSNKSEKQASLLDNNAESIHSEDINCVDSQILQERNINNDFELLNIESNNEETNEYSKIIINNISNDEQVNQRSESFENVDNSLFDNINIEFKTESMNEVTDTAAEITDKSIDEQVTTQIKENNQHNHMFNSPLEASLVIKEESSSLVESIEGKEEKVLKAENGSPLIYQYDSLAEDEFMAFKIQEPEIDENHKRRPNSKRSDFNLPVSKSSSSFLLESDQDEVSEFGDVIKSSNIAQARSFTFDSGRSFQNIFERETSGSHRQESHEKSRIPISKGMTQSMAVIKPLTKMQVRKIKQDRLVSSARKPREEHPDLKRVDGFGFADRPSLAENKKPDYKLPTVKKDVPLFLTRVADRKPETQQTAYRFDDIEFRNKEKYFGAYNLRSRREGSMVSVRPMTRRNVSKKKFEYTGKI